MKYEAHEWDVDTWAVNVVGDRDNPIAYCGQEADATMIARALNTPTVRIETVNPHLQALIDAALAFAATPVGCRIP